MLLENIQFIILKKKTMAFNERIFRKFGKQPDKFAFPHVVLIKTEGCLNNNNNKINEESPIAEG